MSENISSSVLFHFTNSIENLKSILKHGFYPHYCPEYLIGPSHAEAAVNDRPPIVAIPMVCFCDLPLSLIRKHIDDYGHFGIGLSKDWGIQKGVTPVLYFHRHSQLFGPLSDRILAAKEKNDTQGVKDMMLLASYTKPFLGFAWRNGRTLSDVPFYDEREWRYVPQTDASEQLFLLRKDYTDKVKIKALHETFRRQFNLAVYPDDIQYLIVPDEKSVLELAKYISNSRYKKDDAILVTTAIMTTDCIHQDV